MSAPEIRLARPEARFAPGVLAYSRDATFFRYLDSAPMAAPEEAQEFLAHMRDENTSGARDYFVIVDAANDNAIGTIGFLFPYPRRHRVADLGYGLARSYWGSGAFQAACRLALVYGFESLSLARIQVTTRADNPRAIKAVEKVGFRQEALLRSFYQANDGRVDGVLLVLLRDDWRR